MFEGIASMGRDQDIIQVAAAGIKVKLIVTVWGLMVGIPAYMFFNYFSSAVNQHVLEAEETASQLVEALILQLAPSEANRPLPVTPATNGTTGPAHPNPSGRTS